MTSDTLDHVITLVPPGHTWLIRSLSPNEPDFDDHHYLATVCHNDYSGRWSGFVDDPPKLWRGFGNTPIEALEWALKAMKESQK